jgi:hypothetical protein
MYAQLKHVAGRRAWLGDEQIRWNSERVPERADLVPAQSHLMIVVLDVMRIVMIAIIPVQA